MEQLEGLKGFKILSEKVMTEFTDKGFGLFVVSIIIIFVGIVLIGATISAWLDSYGEFCWRIFILAIAVIILGMYIKSVSSRDEYEYEIRQYAITPIEETYSIDMNKYKIIKTVDEIITIEIKREN